MCMHASTEIAVPVELGHPKNDINALGPFPSILSEASSHSCLGLEAAAVHAHANAMRLMCMHCEAAQG